MTMFIHVAIVANVGALNVARPAIGIVIDGIVIVRLRLMMRRALAPP